MKADHIRFEQHVDEIGRVREGGQVNDRVSVRGGTPHGFTISQATYRGVSQSIIRRQREAANLVSASQKMSTHGRTDGATCTGHQNSSGDLGQICHSTCLVGQTGAQFQ